MNDPIWEEHSRVLEERVRAKLISSLEDDLGRKLNDEEVAQIEDLLGLAKQRGEEMSEIETEPENICKFCGCEVDNDIEHDFIAGLPDAMPKTLRSRMAWGFQRDKDGEWMHANVWQCILSWQAAYSPLTIPELED